MKYLKKMKLKRFYKASILKKQKTKKRQRNYRGGEKEKRKNNVIW